MDEIIRRGLHRAFALQHLPISGEDILRLIDLCNLELESRRLQEISEAQQMVLPIKGQTIWYRSVPDPGLLPNFLFWLSKGTCAGVHSDHVVATKGPTDTRHPRTIFFKNLILNRQSYSRIVAQAIGSYGTNEGYHQVARELRELDLAGLGWLVYHHGAGRNFESVGLIPELARNSAPNRISTNAPVLSLEVALEAVWKILESTLQIQS